jgi:hypothetical protein
LLKYKFWTSLSKIVGVERGTTTINGRASAAPALVLMGGKGEVEWRKDTHRERKQQQQKVQFVAVLCFESLPDGTGRTPPTTFFSTGGGGGLVARVKCVSEVIALIPASDHAVEKEVPNL